MKQLICITLALSVGVVHAMDPQKLTPPSSPVAKKRNRTNSRPAAESYPQPIRLTVNVKPNMTATNDSSSSSQAETKTNVKTTSQAQALLKSIKKSYQAHAPAVYQGIWNNLGYLIAGGCLVSVLYL